MDLKTIDVVECQSKEFNIVIAADWSQSPHILVKQSRKQIFCHKANLSEASANHHDENVTRVEIISLDSRRDLLWRHEHSIVTGEFTGLSEGAVADTFPGFGMFITYTAGDGNDVALFPAGFAGDLTLDGELTAADIDEAYRLIRDGGQPQIASAEPNPAPAGVFDRADVDFLVRTLLGTEYGDVNLDGVVGNADFGAVLGNFGAAGVGWAGGDLDGSGGVGNGDFGLLLANFGFQAPPGFKAAGEELATVPEPTTLLMAMVALAASAIFRRSTDRE